METAILSVKDDVCTIVIQKLANFKEIQKLVGGDVEELLCGHEAIALINENGKSLNLPRNDVATTVINHFLNQIDRCLLPGDYISGTMVVVGRHNSKGDYTDVPKNVVSVIQELWEKWRDGHNSDRREGG